MKWSSGLFLAVILLLVLGLIFSGCGQAGVSDGEDAAKKGEGGVKDDGSGDSAPGSVVVDVDFSDPEKVVSAFWGDYSTGKFDRAAQYLSGDARDDLQYFRSIWEANPYALAVWKLMVKSDDAKIIGRGTSGDWIILNLELTKPDFEAIMDTEEGEKVLFNLLILLALSGFEMDEISNMAAGSGMKFSDGAWNSAFAEFERTVAKLPKISENIQIELIKVGGKWMVDSIPFDDLFM